MKKQNKYKMEESKVFETVLIIDTEGNPELREIGAILWNLRTNETFEFSSHIPHSVAKIDEFKSLVAKCDAIIGHVISYDKSMLKRNSINIDDKISICSYNNFQWPENMKSLGLEIICEYFNIKPVGIHTAIGDSRLLRQCLMCVPDYFSQLQDAFHEKGKRHKIIQLIHSNTKLVEFKNGQTVITQFLLVGGNLREHAEKHDGWIIPCPPTLEIYGTVKHTMENIRRLQWYIINEYPILVKRVRILRHPYLLFVIGSKSNNLSVMEINNINEQSIQRYIFKTNIKKRKHPRKTVILISPGTKIMSCKQGDNVITRFKWNSSGYFQKCKYKQTHKLLSTVQFPETIEILDNSKYFDNVEKMKTYIPNHSIRVDHIQTPNGEYGLLFNIGEPISKLCNMEYIESKSESFRILNQTNLNNGTLFQYLDENKYLLTCLQENKLRFAPICLNNINFILRWNVTTNTLEIVPDQS